MHIGGHPKSVATHLHIGPFGPTGDPDRTGPTGTRSPAGPGWVRVGHDPSHHRLAARRRRAGALVSARRTASALATARAGVSRWDAPPGRERTTALENRASRPNLPGRKRGAGAHAAVLGRTSMCRGAGARWPSPDMWFSSPAWLRYLPPGASAPGGNPPVDRALRPF